MSSSTYQGRPRWLRELRRGSARRSRGPCTEQGHGWSSTTPTKAEGQTRADAEGLADELQAARAESALVLAADVSDPTAVAGDDACDPRPSGAGSTSWSTTRASSATGRVARMTLDEWQTRHRRQPLGRLPLLQVRPGDPQRRRRDRQPGEPLGRGGLLRPGELRGGQGGRPGADARPEPRVCPPRHPSQRRRPRRHRHLHDGGGCRARPRRIRSGSSPCSGSDNPRRSPTPSCSSALHCQATSMGISWKSMEDGEDRIKKGKMRSCSLACRVARHDGVRKSRFVANFRRSGRASARAARYNSGFAVCRDGRFRRGGGQRWHWLTRSRTPRRNPWSSRVRCPGSPGMPRWGRFRSAKAGMPRRWWWTGPARGRRTCW